MASDDAPLGDLKIVLKPSEFASTRYRALIWSRMSAPSPIHGLSKKVHLFLRKYNVLVSYVEVYKVERLLIRSKF
jgi:hypothetical protein